MSLSEFLRARLAEDEAVARAATPGPWRWDTSEGSFCGEPDPDTAPAWGHRGPDLVTDAEVDDRDIISSSGYDADNVIIGRADAEHIARHDPARVLAEVTAKRALLDDLDAWQRTVEIDGDRYARGQLAARQAVAAAWGRLYAAHPGYQPEWAP